jgi:hypothetical protein
MKRDYSNADYYVCNHCENTSNDNNDKVECSECGEIMTAVHNELLLSEERGIYIPNNFYSEFDFTRWNLDKDEYTVLNDIENEYYWDAWDTLLNNAYCEHDGVTWRLEQDGDLLAVTYIEHE